MFPNVCHLSPYQTAKYAKLLLAILIQYYFRSRPGSTFCLISIRYWYLPKNDDAVSCSNSEIGSPSACSAKAFNVSVIPCLLVVITVDFW